MTPEPSKSKRGGYRPGSGRKPKARQIRETAVDVVLRRRAGDGVEPLQVMLDAMDQVRADNGPVAAFPFAQACAPYMHAKLANMEVRTMMTGADGGPIAVTAITPAEYRRIAVEVARKV